MDDAPTRPGAVKMSVPWIAAGDSVLLLGTGDADCAWQLPKFDIGPDETPEDAAVRGVRDELDVAIAPGGRLGSTDVEDDEGRPLNNTSFGSS